MQSGSEFGTPAQRIKAGLYILMNIGASTGIVFANKVVFVTFSFHFVTTLTLIHTLFTFSGMLILSRVGFFEAKPLPAKDVFPLALSYVGYVVLGNASLSLNTVALYQILKIAVAPAVMFLEFTMLNKTRSRPVVASVVIVCAGVTYATVTDKVVVQNLTGLSVGLLSTLVTAVYQIWVGSKQKDLKANSSQLLLAYTPQAIGILAALLPLADSIGLSEASRTPESLLGYNYTPAAVAAIVLSAVLGVLVSLSTFLVIGATSSLTYNVVGHMKTVMIFAGAFLVFHEHMSAKRMLGISITAVGIIWYTWLQAQPSPPSLADKAGKQEGSTADTLEVEAVPLLNGSEHKATARISSSV